MSTNKITSVQSLLDFASENYFCVPRGQWVFRGHSNYQYNLKPSVGRGEHGSRSDKKYEESLFDIFCREARPYLNPIPTNEWDWLAVAQHHLLPTRLLDFSINPLVALYFSVGGSSDVDGELFALNAPTKASRDVLSESPFKITKPVKYYPNVVSARIRAQEGLFIVCSETDQEIDKNLRSDWAIQRFIVPSSCKRKIRYELFRLGVHDSSLFPDIDGLAARLKWQHSKAATQSEPA